MLDVLPHFSVTTNIVYLLHSKKGFEKECNVLKAVYVNGIPFFFFSKNRCTKRVNFMPKYYTKG